MRIWLWNQPWEFLEVKLSIPQKMRIVIPILIFFVLLLKILNIRLDFMWREEEKTLVLIQNTVVMLHGLKSRTWLEETDGYMDKRNIYHLWPTRISCMLTEQPSYQCMTKRLTSRWWKIPFLLIVMNYIREKEEKTWYSRQE